MSEPAELEAVRAEQQKRVLRERLMRVLLTSEARQRLTNVEMVKPDVAESIKNYIVQMASQGKLKKALTDDELKEILNTIQQPKRDFKIRWA